MQSYDADASVRATLNAECSFPLNAESEAAAGDPSALSLLSSFLMIALADLRLAERNACETFGDLSTKAAAGDR